MEAECCKAQKLHCRVKATDVALLVEDDVAPLSLCEGGWQIDPGPQDPHDEGGVDVIGEIDVVPEPHSPHDAAPQAAEGDQTITQHPDDANEPRPGGDLRQ